MPEDNSNNSSGIPSGGKKPTIIGCAQPSSTVKKPTVISLPGSGAKDPTLATTKKAPTVIPGEKQSTVIPSPSTTIIPDTPRPHNVSTPTRVQGTVRQGIKVTAAELKAYYLGHTEEALNEAVVILHRTIIELVSDADCASWGVLEQKQYSELTERSLALISGPDLQRGQAHLGRLLQILEELAEAFQHKGPEGFAFWKKEANPMETLERYKPELSKLRGLLESLLPQIVIIDGALDAIVEELKTLITKLNASAIAAQYLAEHILDKTARSRAIQNLESRRFSLTETTALIDQGLIIREQTKNNFNRLILKIQDCVLNALPAWIDMLATQLPGKLLTETDLFIHRQSLEDIINNIK